MASQTGRPIQALTWAQSLKPKPLQFGAEPGAQGLGFVVREPSGHLGKDRAVIAGLLNRPGQFIGRSGDGIEHRVQAATDVFGIDLGRLPALAHLGWREHLALRR
jgi:hypothetical protein